MKNVFTLCLMLIFISIFVNSCSQISNNSLAKSNKQQELNMHADFNIQNENLNIENNLIPDKGINKFPSDNSERTEIANINDLQVVLEKTPQSNNLTQISETPSKGVVREDVNIIQNENGQSAIIVNENNDISTTNQQANNSNNQNKSVNNVPFFLIFLCAFFIPPLGVALMFGITDKFWICLALTLLFWLPGMIYAMIQIFG